MTVECYKQMSAIKEGVIMRLQGIRRVIRQINSDM